MYKQGQALHAIAEARRPPRHAPTLPSGPLRPGLGVVRVGPLWVLLTQLHTQGLHRRRVQPTRLQAGGQAGR